MTDEEWADLALLLWQWCWPYGTQQDKAELLVIKARIEAAVSSTSSQALQPVELSCPFLSA